MDIVYSQAELTIIAACAKDVNAGLAGIRQGTRRRRTMSHKQGRHIVTLELSFDKYDLLQGTAYCTRGWTFQELVLLKRTLFVMEHQLVFHCGTSRCSESLPREDYHHSGDFEAGTIDLRPKKDQSCDINVILKSYSAMVEEYCERRLTFQTDIENAFSGLASILVEWCERCPVISGLLSGFLGHAMLWRFKKHTMMFSSYSLEETGKRRQGFPSWS
jgi:hypothetical protein